MCCFEQENREIQKELCVNFTKKRKTVDKLRHPCYTQPIVSFGNVAMIWMEGGVAVNTVLTCIFGAGAYPVYAFPAPLLTGHGLGCAGKYVYNTDL